MVASAHAVDLYAVLQVHPGADQEIIEAAYRQLMKKYHPDVAGEDPQRIAYHHQRAKAINEAYGVLRDPQRRQLYDAWRTYGGGRPWTASSPPASGANSSVPPSPSAPPPPAQAQAAARPTTASAEPIDPTSQEAWREPEASLLDATLRAPFAALAAAYYLLPGPYEWEAGRRHELRTICLVPPIGIGAFALATGRLGGLVGHSATASILAWALLLALSLPLWSSLPRVVMAAVPSGLLLAGNLQPLLRQVGIPVWLAWVLLGLLSLILSARVYVFGVLPTLGACWLLSRLG